MSRVFTCCIYKLITTSYLSYLRRKSGGWFKGKRLFQVILIALALGIGLKGRNAFSQMAEFPTPLPEWEIVLPQGSGFLTRVASRFSVGVFLYDSLKQRVRWTGAGEGEIILLSTPSWHWEWRLSWESLADDRNDIYFRVLRLFYQAFTGLRIPVGETGILTAGYQHRCSHGADNAEPGRILIRSGPKISYIEQLVRTPWEVSLHGAVEPTLIGQNADWTVNPRILLSAGLDIRGSPWILGATWGVMGITRGTKETFSVGSPLNDPRARGVVALSAGLFIPGGMGELKILFRFSQIHDSGLTSSAKPLSLFGLILAFDS